MIVNKKIKERVKKSKPCSEYVLGPFFDLKAASKVLAIASFFMFSSAAHAAWWDGAENSSGQPANPETVNVNGGAIALGHPLGCTGAKLSIQLLNEMKRREQRYGMVTACVGGGQGIAGIFERL